MTLLERYYPEVAFGGFTRVDGTVAFYTRVSAFVGPESIVLDVGCGRGSRAEDPVDVRRTAATFRGRCRRVIGIDVDPVGVSNPTIDEFHLIEGPEWPVADASVDVVIAYNVLEHIPDPTAFINECNRVLRPGGYVAIRTTNLHGYVGVFGRLIPNSRHAGVLSRVQQGRDEKDVFPTLYRCNTPRKLHNVLTSGGFRALVYGHDAEPDYLSFSRIAYFVGVLLQRFTPDAFKPALFAFGRKTQ